MVVPDVDIDDFHSSWRQCDIAAYGAELFPTSYRSTAAGARVVVATIGGSIGLALESVRMVWDHTGKRFPCCGACSFGPILVMLTFPETSGRTLEEIAPER